MSYGKHSMLLLFKVAMVATAAAHAQSCVIAFTRCAPFENRVVLTVDAMLSSSHM
jgi:hypothetical protein